MNPIDNNEVRERLAQRSTETFAATPQPVRTGVSSAKVLNLSGSSAKAVNLSVSAATTNVGMVRHLSGEKFKANDGAFVGRFNLAAPSKAVGNIDLEWFVGMFQIKSDEASVNANRDQLKQEKASLKPKHDRVISNIRLSVTATKNSESAKQLQKILGTVTAAASIAGAVLAVFTFGASLAAALAIVGAALAVIGSIFSLTEVDEKIQKGLSDLHKMCSGASDEDCDKFGQQFYAFFGMGVNIAVSMGGGVSGFFTEVREGINQGIQTALKVSVGAVQFSASMMETGGNANAAVKNTIATVQEAQQRVTEANMRQQTNMVDQIVNELDRSVEMLFADWSAFDKTIQSVANTKGMLASNICTV